MDTDRVDRKKVGMLTVAAGACFIVGALLSEAVDALWILILVGLAILLYTVPKLHAFQAPADGAAGEWGSRLVLLGVALLVALGVVFIGWEAVGTPPEENTFINALWFIGFFAFLIGIVLFSIGTAQAKVWPQAAPILMLVAIVGAVAIDMATGAFFEDDPDMVSWGFIIGVPLFGLGLAWIGFSLWREEKTSAPPPVEGS